MDWRDLAALSTIAAYAWVRPRRAVVSCSAAGIVLSLFVANAFLKRSLASRVSLSPPPSALCFFKHFRALMWSSLILSVQAVLSVQAFLSVQAVLSCLVCATFVVNVAAFALH